MTVPLQVLTEAIADRSAKGIAASVSRLITGGTLGVDARLPTVRSLAAALAVSPTTVSEAWQVLADAGAINPRGRLGTFVLGPPTPLAPKRYRSITEHAGEYVMDLSTGTPDPELLPDLAGAFGAVVRTTRTTSYLDDAVLPALADVLHEIWPFPPAALTVVDGAMDALDRLATSLVRLGDRVIVENPTFPPLLDLLEQLGAEVIGVPVDAEGIEPDALRRALAADPSVLITMPRAHNPLGVSTTAERAAELAEVLAGSEVFVIEDDHAGDISRAPLASLGVHLPDRTILIRSYSKSHGPDLRLAAIGGAAEPIRQVAQRRILGPGWSSRLLQAVLAELLVDPVTMAAVSAAGARYAERRAAMSRELQQRGVQVTGTDGINLWVAVPDERSAQLGLAARGIGVAPGTPFMVEPRDGDHLRVTIATVRDGFDTLADHIAGVTDPAGDRSLRAR